MMELAALEKSLESLFMIVRNSSFVRDFVNNNNFAVYYLFSQTCM